MLSLVTQQDSIRLNAIQELEGFPRLQVSCGEISCLLLHTSVSPESSRRWDHGKLFISIRQMEMRECVPGYSSNLGLLGEPQEGPFFLLSPFVVMLTQLIFLSLILFPQPQPNVNS